MKSLCIYVAMHFFEGNANSHLVMNSFGTLFHENIFPWLLTTCLTFPWHVPNSLTFPGFPAKWVRLSADSVVQLFYRIHCCLSSVHRPGGRVGTCRALVCASSWQRQGRYRVWEDGCVRVLEKLDVVLQTAVCRVRLLKTISQVVQLRLQSSLVLLHMHCWFTSVTLQ